MYKRQGVDARVPQVQQRDVAGRIQVRDKLANKRGMLGRAALERDLTPEMSSPLHIVPGGYDDVRRAIGWPGTKVVMKARRSLADTKRFLCEEGAFDGAELVEDCGLPGERVYRSLDDVPDRGSYFSTMVVR